MRYYLNFVFVCRIPPPRENGAMIADAILERDPTASVGLAWDAIMQFHNEKGLGNFIDAGVMWRLHCKSSDMPIKTMCGVP